MSLTKLALALDDLYNKFNRKEFIAPDPLEWVLRFQNPVDQEIAGLLASSLAYGNVVQILASLENLFNVIKTPQEFILNSSPKQMSRKLASFKHRWHTGTDIAALLGSLKKILSQKKSLKDFFLKYFDADDENILPSLSRFVAATRELTPFHMRPNLLPSPSDNSACKRINMFMRWMVRYDAVDTGLWCVIPASKLIMPLDTHIHKLALALGLTKKTLANLDTAIEITNKFKKISPEDPVRFDFCLARLGINKSATVKEIRKTFLEYNRK